MKLIVILALNALISSVTFVVMYGIWKYSAGRKDMRYGIGLGYHMLHILVIMLMFPFFLLWRRFRGGMNHDSFLADRRPFADGMLTGLALAWIMGAAFRCLNHFTQVIAHYNRSRDMMACGRHTHGLAAEIAAQMNISRQVQVVEGYCLFSPELGMWNRPYICLPVKDYEDETLRNILTHELVHYKSGDKLIRELMVLLTCIHWFNPACRYAVADLKIWDEYHCDYIVCQHRHIRRSSYCETLYAMYELGERRKSQFVPGFCEEKSDLRKRLEQMKRYEPKTKKNRRMAWTAAILFTAVGIVTALGTSAGVAYAYEKAAEIIRVCDEGEGNDKANGLKEHIRIPSEGTKGTDMIQSEAGLLALGSFECSIKNQAYFLSLCELAQIN